MNRKCSPFLCNCGTGVVVNVQLQKPWSEAKEITRTRRDWKIGAHYRKGLEKSAVLSSKMQILDSVVNQETFRKHEQIREVIQNRNVVRNLKFSHSKRKLFQSNDKTTHSGKVKVKICNEIVHFLLGVRWKVPKWMGRVKFFLIDELDIRYRRKYGSTH